MVRPLQMQDSDNWLDGCIPLAIGLFVSVSAVATLCAKHARRVSRNYTINDNDHDISFSLDKKISDEKMAVVSKSPLRSPKKFISSLSNKAINAPFFSNHKKGGDGDGDGDEFWKREKDLLEEEGFGEGGLWQKDILMGEKCQPPEFSGVIYYDCDGKQISELPRSPPPTSSFSAAFSFPVVPKDDVN